MEPSSTLTLLFGKLGMAKVGMAVAAFAGAVLSLAFLKGLTRPQMIVAVIVGFFSSFYGTPLAVHYLGLSQQTMEIRYGVAFVIGLLAMNIIPALRAWLTSKPGATT